MAMRPYTAGGVRRRGRWRRGRFANRPYTRRPVAVRLKPEPQGMLFSTLLATNNQVLY